MSYLIIDTDIGVDDAYAVKLAVLSGELLGVTTTYGNASVVQTTKNAKLALKTWQKSFKVYRGASRPLVIKPPVNDGHIHGIDGLGACYENNESPDADDAIHFIVECARKYKGEVTLLTIGPLTNLALALNIEPNLPNLLKGVISMGGAFGRDGHTGNMTHFAEFNIFADPHAAEEVCSAPFNLTLIPLDITHQVLIDEKDIASYHDEFLSNISKFYLDFSEKYEKFRGMCVHDALTAVYYKHPEFFEVTKSPIAVSTEGITFGQTHRIISSYASIPFDIFKDRPVHNIILNGDVKAIKEYMCQEMNKEN